MRVAVDGRALRPGAVHERGVAGYLRWLLEALGELAPDDEYVVVVPSLADPEPLRAANVRLVRRRVPSQVLFGAVPLLGRPRLDRLAGGCDVAWAPAPRPLAVSRDVNYVLTLHDLAFVHRPSDFSAYERAWHRLARPHRLAQAAARVICVSGPVRDEAVARWRLDPERTRVVAHGPGRPPGPAAALPAGLEEGFVLAVGALEPRKRPGLLVEGHRRAREQGLAAGLVFAGDGPLRGALERTHATVLGHVGAPQLESLYTHALALACVSREEGFGFTPVEAISRGTPAIVAELPVFTETLGQGALRVAPGDADALAEALLAPGALPGLARSPGGGRARGHGSALLGARRARDSCRAGGGGAMTAFAIVTVIHDSERDLPRLLDSIERHLSPRPQVVVVDSGSSDEGGALAAARGARVVTLDSNRGFGAGCNAGLEIVEAPVTALVNPDVELLDGGLERLAAEAARCEALIAPRLLNSDGSVQDSAHPTPGRLEALVPALVPRPLLPPPLRRRYEPWRSDRPRPVGWAVAACLVARTDLLRRLGPFDPAAFLFYEDMELCLRARGAAIPTLLRPQVALRHRGGASTVPALGARELCMRARRRREVVALEGSTALALDDLAEAVTYSARAGAKRLARRGGGLELARLRALRGARREMRS